MITDRAEALRITVSIMNTCRAHKECYTCPFADTTNKNCVVREALDVAIDNLEKERQKILKMLVEATKDIVIPVKDEKETKEKEQNLLKSFINDKAYSDFVSRALRRTIGQSVVPNDYVNHPSHYQKGGMECIDAIRAAVANLSGFEAYCVGNIVKYVWRYKEKNGAEDLRKAKHYLEWLIEEVNKNG